MTLAVLVEPVEAPDEPLLKGEVVVACVAAEPVEPEVAVEVQDTAVGRLVTAFALQRLRAYVVAACWSASEH